jgi:hypothetical protein
MAPTDPRRPQVFARFPPDPGPMRILANFTPDPSARPTVYATFEPSVYEKAQEALVDLGLAAPLPDTPPPQPLTIDQSFLAAIKSLLSPDNYQTQYKYVTAQVNAGQAYDYAFPSWTRHVLITNTDTTDTGFAGQLYYWYDNPQNGAKVLPQNYATLTSGQSVSENSDFHWLTLYANSGATAQSWEVRFSGRVGDTQFNPKQLRSPTAVKQTPGGVKTIAATSQPVPLGGGGSGTPAAPVGGPNPASAMNPTGGSGVGVASPPLASQLAMRAYWAR